MRVFKQLRMFGILMTESLLMSSAWKVQWDPLIRSSLTVNPPYKKAKKFGSVEGVLCYDLRKLGYKNLAYKKPPL